LPQDDEGKSTSAGDQAGLQGCREDGLPLSAGMRVGPYEILSPLSADGAGEVYRARDTRAAREVAVRILPEAIGKDPGRLARIEREAGVMATLDHSHVAAVFGLESFGGTRVLARELVEGESLAERLSRGPIPVDEAIEIARQVAEGLEAAHDKGIVHGDLRPDRIKRTAANRVKVLDFGLAGAMGVPPAGASESAAAGDLAYRAPEQARGKPPDRQSDIWAFGAILFEMLAGKRAFPEGTASEMTALLTREPDWQALPAAIPPSAERVLQRCLQRNLHQRLHDIADARIEIEHARAESPSGPRPSPPARLPVWKLAVSFLMGALVAGVALWSGLRPAPHRTPRRERLNITLPAIAPLVGEGLPVAALSPDGSRLVYVAAQGARSILYLRQLDRIEARPIPGTEGALSPFFSPDGLWIGFQADGRLKKIPLTGGQAIALCDAPQLRGASWGPDNTILFAADLEGGLSRISAAGGQAQTVTKVDPKSGQTSHRWPQILPDGKTAVFSTLTNSGREEEREIDIVTIETGQWRTLLRGGNYPRYATSGYLLYARGTALMAAPFDLKRLDLTGAAVPVLESVRSRASGSGVALFDVSQAGSLIYVPSDAATASRSLLWVDRKGQIRPVTHTQRAYEHPAISPDGKRLAVVIHGTDDDIWISDLEKDAWTRLTFEADNQEPIWAPDGKRIVFSSNRKGVFNLFSILADGSAPPEPLFVSEDWIYPNSFSPDGALVAFSQQTRSGYDIGLAPVTGGAPRPFLASALEELMPRFSPDGKWIAYVSRESGQADVYVRPYPGPAERTLVSTRGGDEPAWNPNGRELFYREAGRMMAVPIQSGSEFSAGAPEALFEGPFEPGNEFVNYDVTRDGQRFLMIRGPETAPLQIVVVPDWFEELQSRLQPPRK
jgi:serine/threonine-protein kinase